MITQEETASARPPLSLAQRRAFMELPLEERRRILAEQAAQIAEHYASPETEEERENWQGGDIVES
ncbi:MAG TPA: hypothetical protein VJZ91_08850 [Blastocatellia bacterium]|nr:hypothetical protein [Blastocatellia bacterium]